MPVIVIHQNKTFLNQICSKKHLISISCYFELTSAGLRDLAWIFLVVSLLWSEIKSVRKNHNNKLIILRRKTYSIDRFDHKTWKFRKMAIFLGSNGAFYDATRRRVLFWCITVNDYITKAWKCWHFLGKNKSVVRYNKVRSLLPVVRIRPAMMFKSCRESFWSSYT